MAAPSVSLRAKRENTTVFLNCAPGDTMLLLKSRLSEVENVDASRIRILGVDRLTIFEDESTVADHQLKDNDIIFFVLKGETGDTYEDVKPHLFADHDVPDPTDGTEGSEAKK